MKQLLLSLAIGIVLIGCETKTETPVAVSIPEVISLEPSSDPVTLEFPSLDSLLITANLYDHGNEAPVIVLCHQARYNKFEYSEIAKTLFDNGFNCIAIDQRSGGPIVESSNETALRAIEADKPVDYIDAEQDIVAAINFAADKYNRKIILWGSSYSSTLALHLASENEKIEAVIAFSPGDYLDEYKGDLKSKLVHLKTPMFVTSSKTEAPELTTLVGDLTNREFQTQFIPTQEGKHGSKALWKTNEDNEDYWTAILNFLNEIDQVAN